MDVLSHGLWGVAAARHRLRWWVAATSGALGDVIAFLPARSQELVEGRLNFRHEVRPMEAYPAITQHLYNASHSLTGLVCVFSLVYLCLKIFPKLSKALVRPGVKFDSAARLAFWVTIPWALHIAMDVPLHTREFFPTPVLWPWSHWVVDGVPWAQKAIVIPNVILLALALWWSSRRLKNGNSENSLRSDEGMRKLEADSNDKDEDPMNSDNQQQKPEEEGQKPVEFGMSPDDLEAISQGQSEVVPNKPIPKKVQRTPYTINNAPMAKRAVNPMRKQMPIDREAPVEFQASSADEQAIASGLTPPKLPIPEKTPYTIENAPVAKMVQDDYIMEIPVPPPEQQSSEEEQSEE